MAEVKTDTTEMLKHKTDSDIPEKIITKQNGIDREKITASTDEKSESVNGLSDDVSNGQTEEIMEIDNDKEEKPHENGKEEATENENKPLVLSDNGDSDNVESIRSSVSPVVVHSDISQDEGDNTSEGMDVDKEDGDSNMVDLSSNISAANSDVIEVGHNDSNNPSLISEDSSRDSLASGESVKSGNSVNIKQTDGLVETVKVDDGDEILITLNDEDGCKDKSPDKNSDSLSDENIKETKKQVSEDTKIDANEKAKEAKSSEVAPGTTVVKTIPVIQSAASVTVSAIPSGTNLIFQTSTSQVLNTAQNIILQGANIPVGCQLVRQGNQLGYVSIVGKQHIFVPVSNTVPTTVAKNPMLANQLAPVQQPPQKAAPIVKPEDLKPKSSLEMIELMKWEMVNRVPDNYNWAVAFHGRKDELSSITSFLQELGSDVVKEQVYKDIIQIQTKKKVAGELKDPEIESLEKMKTVYENTKKKVEHLQLETKECGECKFKTESNSVMNYHKDFPHYDPPWDINKGWLMCAHCDFKTKTVAHFIFHEKDIHNVQAKFIEKDQFFQCSLCPLNASTKNKLEKHQQKCMKHFKLNSNLQPYYHDVNFCMKTCFYKPKKVVPKPPPPKPVVKPTMLTRQQGAPPVAQSILSQNKNIQQINPAIRPNTNVAIRQRLPVTRSPAPQQNVQRPQIQQPRPRLTPPTLQRAPIPQQKPVRPPNKEMSGFEVCELCGGYVKDRQALRIHFYYAHKVEMPQAIFNRPNPPLTCDVCKSHYWTTQGLSKHKSAQRHFIGAKPPISSGKITTEMECFMCMKRFPNLFVHFEKTHGMTMKDLVLVRKCIMCGLAASDYASLETHLVHTHGILIKVNDYITDKAKPSLPPRPSPSTALIGGGKNVGKINYCVFCQIQFPDNIQLTMHCIKIHATCKTCGMVVATSKHLADHSCRKAHINRSCYICGAIVTSQEKYAIHLRSHVKPCRVKIENLTAEEIVDLKEKIKREYKPAVISLDSEEDSDVEVVETKPSNMKVVLEKDGENDVEMVDLSEDVDENSVKTSKSENNADAKNNVDISESSKSFDKDKSEMTVESANSSDPKVTCKESENKEELDKSKNESTETKDNDPVETNADLSQSVETKEKDDSETEVNNDSKAKDNDLPQEGASQSWKARSSPIGNCEDKTFTESKNVIEALKADSTAGSNESKVKLGERLLTRDTEEGSVSSNEICKRKKSESDIDEDELLKDDDSGVKRLKVENDSNVKAENDVAEKSESEVVETNEKFHSNEEMSENIIETDLKTESI